MSDLDVSLGRRVRVLRKSAGLTQETLAAELTRMGLASRQQSVNRIETGARRLRLAEAALICAAVGATLNDLMQGEGIPSAVPVGNGDDLDVLAGRCCPTCRHDLGQHNKSVWNAGYAMGQRHEVQP